MTIGKVIRKYRKMQNLTQEEMAARLGVTAPAVNKWENGNSYPDITLLAPIARLLGISLDTLLSFRESLTDQEITDIVQQTDQLLKEKPYDEVFRFVQKKAEKYPNCDELLMNLAVIMDAQLIIRNIPDTADYEKYICSLYLRVLDSKEESLRIRAADALVSFYMRKEQYETAEKYLEYFSVQNPEKKRKQAQIYEKTGRIQKACQMYEELLFSDYQRASASLNGIYMAALSEKDMKRARYIVDKQIELAKCFEMGKYYEISVKLDLALLEKNADEVIETVGEMLDSVEHIGDFRNSRLYEHMKFKEMSQEFVKELRDNLIKCFQDEESYGFLQGDERWAALIRQFEN